MQGMEDLLRQAQQMQSKMTELQEELAKKTIEGSSGGGMVRVTANGKMEILSVRLEPDVIDPGEVEMLQDLITAAVNDALRNAKGMAEREMAALTGGFRIPGIM
jgi:DNA-binding protein, YbaB/EbfC family